LYRGVPPGVIVDDRVSRGQVKATAASLETDQEDGNRWVRLKALDGHIALFGRAVEVFVLHLVLVERLPDELQHGHELTEDEDLVTSRLGFVHELAQGNQLGAVLVTVRAGQSEEPRVARRLAKLREPRQNVELAFR